MLPLINIFNTKISTYSLLCAVACIANLIFSFHIAKYHKIKKQYIFYAFIFEMIGVFIGARLYYVITHFNIEIFNNWNKGEFIRILLNGVSFTGALIRWSGCNFYIC